MTHNYDRERKMPPGWYIAAGRFYLRNKLLIWIAVYFLIFFVWPFVFPEREYLDPQLLVD